MKTILSIFTLLLCAVTLNAQCPECVTYSADNPPATAKWYRQCEKKVYKPLRKNSHKNRCGSILYEVTTHTAAGISKKKVQLNYICKWESSPIYSAEPFLSMRVDDDTTYYLTRDSLYVFDKTGHLAYVRYFMSETWDFFVYNPFLSFYTTHSFFTGGSTFEPFLYKKEGNVIVADYTSPLFDDGGRKTLRDPYMPGRHVWVLDKKQHTLLQCIYEPCASITAQFGYTKQSYQLLQYNSDLYYLDYPEIIRQRNHK